MGVVCSEHSSNSKCNCFMNDAQIKNIEIIRYSTKNWIWSNNHDNALIHSLSVFYDAIPKEIMYLIKDHSFHHTQEYKIIYPIIKCEKYYSKHNQLLKKKLCQNWYLTQTNFSTEPVTIGLHFANNKQSKSIFNVICDTTLPSLQLHSTKPKYIRTIHVDGCQIRLDLISINNNCNNEKSKYALINMIILNEYDSLVRANDTSKMLWNQRNCMKNCIIVKIRHSMQNNGQCNNGKTIDELAKRYNIPCISICFQNENTITNLFNFAIKYYWFCNVVR